MRWLWILIMGFILLLLLGVFMDLAFSSTACRKTTPNGYHHILCEGSNLFPPLTCTYENQSWHRCTKTFSGDKLIEDTCKEVDD